MKTIRAKLWRFSLTIALGREIMKGYIAYDSASRHLCLHGGKQRGRFSFDLVRLRAYQGPKKKSKKKELYVRQ